MCHLSRTRRTLIQSISKCPDGGHTTVRETGQPTGSVAARDPRLVRPIIIRRPGDLLARLLVAGADDLNAARGRLRGPVGQLTVRGRLWNPSDTVDHMCLAAHDVVHESREAAD